MATLAAAAELLPENLLLAAFVLAPLLAARLLAWVFRAHRRRGRSAALLVAGNALLVLLLLLVSLPVGEVYYRFFCDRTDGAALGLVSERWFARHYRLNNFGIRDDRDYALDVAPGKTRLTFLGDSYTNGHGIPRVEDRFANLIRAEEPLWEVQLFAADGLDTGAILERVRQLLADHYRIQKVVYVYSLNDISDLLPEWQAAVERLYGERLNYLFAHSYFLNTLYYRCKVTFDADLRRYYDNVAAAYAGPTFGRQAERLRSLRDLVAEHGGELYVVTIPFLQHLRRPRNLEIHAQLAAFWHTLGVPQLDLLERFSREPYDKLIVNRFDPHTNEYANRIAAEEIREFLHERFRSESASAP